LVVVAQQDRLAVVELHKLVQLVLILYFLPLLLTAVVVVRQILRLVLLVDQVAVDLKQMLVAQVQ
jgi:hypothetical protein